MTRVAIQDEFRALAVSRQRKWQLRKRQEGRCTVCGKPSVMCGMCLEHYVCGRERQRKKLQAKSRYLGGASYRRQAARREAWEVVGKRRPWPWAKWELELLHKESIAAVAKATGRTVLAVKVKRSELGIVRRLFKKQFEAKQSPPETLGT